MQLERITLVDLHAPLVAAWAEAFADEPRVEVHHDDYFARAGDAMVCPTNSFGIMATGLARAIRDVLGPELEARVQRRIAERHHGELPVGVAEVVATDDERWPYLVVAPTMRAPGPVPRSLNAYLAFRAVLVAVAREAEAASGQAPRIRSIVCPGLATGVGAMSARRCAAQMREALRQLARPARPGASTKLELGDDEADASDGADRRG
jgi:O-acetyl-ADP-ribose deacetylase (regulator of RNase III)